MFKKTLYIALVFMTVVGFSPHAGEASIFRHIYYDDGSIEIRIEDDEAVKIEEVASNASNAVVSISAYRQVPKFAYELIANEETGELMVRAIPEGTVTKRVSSGTGFFITADGYLVTNKHVVDDAEAEFLVNTGFERLLAKVIYSDADHDLAVLKVEGTGFPVIDLAKVKDPEIGDGVVSIGNALGRYMDTVSSGQILSVDETVVAREGRKSETLSGLIMTDARLYPGDSGGPLLDSDGSFLGVNVAIISGTNISFTIPADITREVVRRAGLDV